MTECGKKSIFGQIGARLFLQLLVSFLQLLLAALEFCRERLRLLEQIFGPCVGFNGVKDNSNAFRQLIEKGLVR